MKRFSCYILLFLSLSVGAAFAQDFQSGYVKTRGRMSESGHLIPGKRLPDTSIAVKDGNTVLSDTKGNFVLALTKDEYSISDVKKKGYELVDKDVLWTKYRRSSNPHTIVLDTPDHIWEDSLAIVDKIRNNLSQQLQARRAEINRLREENRITVEEFRQKLQKLYSDQSKDENLIAEMAERYSKMDFDAIDELNLRISHCIVDGRLSEADSLMQTKGSFRSREQELRELQEANKLEREKLSARQKRLEKSERLAIRKLEDLATDSYRKFEIFKQQYLRDSAVYYIKYRAQLDTTNIKWQLEAAKYMTGYVADYKGALSIYNSCLQIVEAQDDCPEELLAEVYNDIGCVYHEILDHTQALEYLTKALEIKERIFKTERQEEISATYNNIGAIYRTLHNYPKSLEYYKKSLVIREQVFGEEHNITAVSYNNVGEVYAQLKDYDKAIEYISKALAIREKSLASDAELGAATCYNNLGAIYQSLRNDTQALEYYLKSVDIREKILGKDHPNVATVYANIGHLYFEKGDLDQSLTYTERAVNILEYCFGEEHPRLGTIYGNLGTTYSQKKNFSEALTYLKKSSVITEQTFGKDHIKTALSYFGIAHAYEIEGNYSEALTYYTKTLEGFEKNLGKEHPNTEVIKWKISKIQSK
ncbi:MAG: tetratricopeptide repeat protein [Alistipes sp.]|nr:tetratricopeptide repeat protein [Alistipes sp.]